MSTRTVLSKQSYLLGLRCHKALHRKIHKKDLYNECKTNSSSFALAAGLDFEAKVLPLLAPKGIDITKSHTNLNFSKYVEETKKHLNKRNVNLYQATFKTKSGELVMADLIQKKGAKIDLMEIKAVMNLQEHHYYDVAFQYHAITSAGVKLNKVYLTHLNKDYVRNGELTADLACKVDVTQKIKQMQKIIKLRLPQMRKMLRLKEEPTNTLGMHCTDPYPCIFKDICWKQALPEHNVFDISGLWMKEKLNLYWAGIVSMSQAKERGIKLNESQKLQVLSTVENKEIIDKAKILEWYEQFKTSKELFFLDFETIAYSVPPYNGGKSYQAVPFQYSLHIRDQLNGKVKHIEFLADPTKSNDQRLELLTNLLSNLKSKLNSPILAYNKSFEAGRLKYLAGEFPAFKKEIYAIIDRLYDLADIYRNRWYVHPSFKGYSIKQVLPALCPDLTYKTLNVRNGDQASAEYLKLEQNNCGSIRENLLEYCKLDTWAMVRIYDALLEKLLIKRN